MYIFVYIYIYIYIERERESEFSGLFCFLSSNKVQPYYKNSWTSWNPKKTTKLVDDL